MAYEVVMLYHLHMPSYFLGSINTIDANDLNFALSVDGCHLVFNE